MKMTKKEYIYHLKNRLRNLPIDEVESAVDYVSELFDEAGEENAEEVARDLGSPAKFAAQIRAEYAINQHCLPEDTTTVYREKPKSNNGWKTLALILLGIAALPVGLPLVLVLAVLIFVAVVVGVCLLFALGCVLLAGFIAVCSLVYAGFKMLTVSLASGLMSIGLGLIGISGVVLIATAAIYLFIKLKPIVINGFANLYNRLKGDKEHVDE
ncbi:MAG TPA: DUF1700 domain-containing protein [Dielma fastidiosa]|nr:DUF1700 domain-containing protein [Dielma fastidiosa]HAH92982.1 DUF1700 domain-containing protein [Dielma fastidiosa]